MKHCIFSYFFGSYFFGFKNNFFFPFFFFPPADIGASVVGVDIGPSIIKDAKTRYPTVEFHTADAWDLNTLMKLSTITTTTTETTTTTSEKQTYPTTEGAGAEATTTTTTTMGYDVILVDVGGLSGDNGLYESLSLLRELTHVFRPRLKALIIKSGKEEKKKFEIFCFCVKTIKIFICKILHFLRFHELFSFIFFLYKQISLRTNIWFRNDNW